MSGIVLGHALLVPLLKVKDISSTMAEFMGLGKITVGVGVYGSAAAYALVWELGSRRLKSPGPKTMWSTNRLGERAILTTQAPHGYVTPTDEFWLIIEEEFDKINFGNAKTSKEVALRIEVAMDNASHRIAKVISQRAPMDSGDLRSQIMGIEADEMQSMSIEDSEDSGTLII